MTYDLLIGDRSYSSWSLRGWLLFEKFDIPVQISETRFYQPGFAEDLKPFHPARTVPVARLPEGAVVMDSLGIAETLAERHPDAGFWPADPNQRALARGITAEMHSGFSALRSTFPMNLRNGFVGVSVAEDVRADLQRIETLWQLARENAASGPWLFGQYSIVDAFYAPVATRIATYDLPVGEMAKDYIATTIGDEAFLKWRRLGLKEAPQSTYDQPYTMVDWPGPD